METMTLEGKMAHHGGDVCVMCVSLAKSLPRGSFFVPAGTHSVQHYILKYSFAGTKDASGCITMTGTGAIGILWQGTETQ